MLKLFFQAKPREPHRASDGPIGLSDPATLSPVQVRYSEKLLKTLDFRDQSWMANLCFYTGIRRGGPWPKLWLENCKKFNFIFLLFFSSGTATAISGAFGSFPRTSAKLSASRSKFWSRWFVGIEMFWNYNTIQSNV